MFNVDLQAPQLAGVQFNRPNTALGVQPTLLGQARYQHYCFFYWSLVGVFVVVGVDVFVVVIVLVTASVPHHHHHHHNHLYSHDPPFPGPPRPQPLQPLWPLIKSFYL